MTDSILRSYYNVSSSMFVPFGAAVVADSSLLAGETDGLAIDFTDTTYFSLATGSQLWNQVRTASVDSLTSPHTFYTQSGTSPKVVKTSSTGLGWSPHNMFLNSAAPVTQNVTLVVGFVYTYGITGAGTLTGSAGASGAATAGSPVTFTATTTTGTFTVSGGTPTTMQINRGIVLTIYLATAGSIVQGLPISYGEGMWNEPAATNLQTRSEEFSNAVWGADGGSSWTADNATGPDGASTADTFTQGAAGSAFTNTHAVVVGSSVYASSIYFKSGTATWMRFDTYNDAAFSAAVARGWFNVSTGTLGTVSLGTASIESVGGGWYRCRVTGTAGSTSMPVSFIAVTADNVTTRDTGATVRVWGAQVELGTVASSYIPTVSASATRATDAVSVATSSARDGATERTLYWEGTVYVPNASNSTTLMGPAGANASTIVYLPTSLSFRSFCADAAAATQCNITIGTPTTRVLFKGAARFKANDFHGAMNGTLAGTPDTSGTFPAVADTPNILFGGTTVQSIILAAKIIVFPRALTNTELQSKTT